MVAIATAVVVADPIPDPLPYPDPSAPDYLARCRAYTIRGWIRRMRSEIERMDVIRSDRQLQQHTFASDEIRYRVWLFDSLCWAFEEIEAGHALFAFRGLLQAAAYAGKVGHTSNTGDAFVSLRNLIEDAIQRGEK